MAGVLDRIAAFLAGGARGPDAPASFHSRFGGLWVDRLDAKDVLREKARKDPRIAKLREALAFFIDNGYVILDKAVDPRAVDRYLAEFEAATAPGGALLASVRVMGPQDKAVVPLAEADLAAPLTKVLDTYAHLAAARELIFAPAIEEFLRAIFEEGVIAFQGLHFETGSTQAVHQDTAYVVCEEPMKLCASWIALQDVVEGCGELIYYAGSHRLPDWIYSGQFKHYYHERDSHDEHMAHVRSLHERSKERGFPLRSFLPRKGDALIWAADLAHGGAPIRDPSLKRRSLVTHYTAESTAPLYFRSIPAEKRIRGTVRPGCSYSTMYY